MSIFQPGLFFPRAGRQVQQNLVAVEIPCVAADQTEIKPISRRSWGGTNVKEANVVCNLQEDNAGAEKNESRKTYRRKEN